MTSVADSDFLVSRSGQSRPEDERLLVHDAELARVGDLLQRRDVRARHLVAADLVLRGVLDYPEDHVELGGLEGNPPSVRIKVWMDDRGLLVDALSKSGRRLSLSGAVIDAVDSD